MVCTELKPPRTALQQLFCTIDHIHKMTTISQLSCGWQKEVRKFFQTQHVQEVHLMLTEAQVAEDTD